MQKYILMFFACSVLLAGCATKKNPVDYVDPMIGTGAHGHTYPGATIPFGMVQLSPDTRIDSWDGCSGYHYTDSTILGFSHTHLSGTGVGDYGDIRLMPTIGKVLFDPGTEAEPETGYRSRFSHDNDRKCSKRKMSRISRTTSPAQVSCSCRKSARQCQPQPYNRLK